MISWLVSGFLDRSGEEVSVIGSSGFKLKMSKYLSSWSLKFYQAGTTIS